MSTEHRGRTSTSSPRRGRTRIGSAPSAAALWSYVLALLLAAVAFIVAPWALLDASPPLEPLVVLTLLAVLGSVIRERELGPHLEVSFAAVVVAAALPLVGPAGAVIVASLSQLADPGPRRFRSRLFNAAMGGCMGGAGGVVYLFIGGYSPIPAGSGTFDLLLHVALPLAIGHTVMTLLNVLAIGLMAQLSGAGPALQMARVTLRSVGVGYFVHAVVAFLFVVLWEPAGVGMFSAVLILAPLILAQWALSRDAAERRSHTLAVRTLVAALETANPYSSGHSARVAELSSRMAPALGVTGGRAEQLQFAALLHDIGLIAVAPRTSGSGPQVDLDYLVEVAEHPEVGVRILQDIEFLSDALPGILHHHERVDGAGYPAGLRGEQIPLFARIIAVADVFDSITTTRSYRDAGTQEQALAILRERAGSHLDPVVVEALAQALVRSPWLPTLIEEEVRTALGDAHDHDDPIVSDLYAQWSPDVDGGPDRSSAPGERPAVVPHQAGDVDG